MNCRCQYNECNNNKKKWSKYNNEIKYRKFIKMLRKGNERNGNFFYKTTYIKIALTWT